MVRTQIYLTKKELAVLQRLERATGKTRSQLIRDAIDCFQPTADDQETVRVALDASAGAWKKRKESGEEAVERLRSGRLARLHR